MVDYTATELDIIRKGRKPSGEKPSYYNSSTDQTEVISDDYEAYLILQKIATKQKILQRLRKNIKDNSNYSDRDAILKEMITNVTSNSASILAELDVETSNFAEFKQSVLNEDRRFDDLVEINRLITVINTSIVELSFHRDQAFQDNSVCLMLSDRLQSVKSDSNTKKEYDVWQKVVSDYKGSK